MTYTVTPQDTITNVSQKFGVPESELLAYNNLSPNSILFPGMIIIIPGRPPIVPTPPQNRVYIVRRGDTIWSIAWRFGVSAESIMRMNGLRFPLVVPGQRLIIPTSFVPY